MAPWRALVQALVCLASVFAVARAQALVPAGPEFQVNSYTPNPQGRPVVAADPTGQFVVVWESVGSPGTDNSVYSVQGQRYSSNGTPLGSQFQVNTYISSNQTDPAIASDPSGNFVVVWTSSGSPGNDNNLTSIQGQRFAANGLPLGNQFQVNTFLASTQQRASVACDAVGNFVVAWESNGSNGTDHSSTSILAQRHAADGTPLGDEFQVNTYTASDQQRPSIAVDAAGNFVVVWTSLGSVGNDQSDTSIQGQRYAADGSPVGGQFQVNTHVVSTQNKPAVAYDAAGNFVATWESNSSQGSDASFYSVHGRRFSSNGTPLGNQFQANTFTLNNQSSPCIAIDSEGNFIIGWNSVGSLASDQSSTSIQFQRYASDGTSVGGETQVNTFINGLQSFPAATFDPFGRLVVVYESAGSPGTDQSDTSVLGQRFVGNFTISATAGLGGSITPGGPISVSSGSNQSFTIAPDSCYGIADVLVDGVSVGAVTNYTFNSVTANHTIEASFILDSFTITASAGVGGSISPLGEVTVNCGADPSFTITPDSCYGVADVLVDGVSVGVVTSYTFNDVMASHTIEASFAPVSFTITASAGAGGSISPLGAVTVNCAADPSFTIAPDSCYGVADVLVDGVSVGAVTNYTFNDVMASHTIEASFAPVSFTITASAGAGGSISPLGAVAVNCAADQSFTIAPDSCYGVADVLVDGASVGAVTNYTFTDVMANHTIEASFALDDFIITASAGIGGSISPTGNIAVSCNGNQSFTVTPDSNNVVLNVIVDGIPVGPVSFYDFVNVMADHTIHANFRSRRTGGSKVLVAQFLQPQTDASASPGKTTMGPASKVTIGSTVHITWPASDRADAPSVDLLLSRAGVNGPFLAIATGIPDVGSSQWTITGPATPSAVLKVVAHDPSDVHCSEDVISTVFQIADASEGGANDPPVIEFALPAITPNPARNIVSISFTIPFATRVAVTVLDVRGRQVATLLDGNLEAGRHGMTWNGEGAAGRAAPGVYFIRVERSGDRLVRRVVFLR